MFDFDMSKLISKTSGSRCRMNDSTRNITVSVACQNRPFKAILITGPSISTKSISPVIPTARDPRR